MQKGFCPLTIEQRENVRKDFRSNDYLFRVLYRPLHIFSVAGLTPEDVWQESCLLVARLARIEKEEREIEISAIHDDLRERYRTIFPRLADMERMVLLVLYTVFLMLLDMHNSQEGHPHLNLVRLIKGYIIDMPGYNELFETCRKSEDQAEDAGYPIPLLDYMDYLVKSNLKSLKQPKSISPKVPKIKPSVNISFFTFSANGINPGHITLLYQHLMDIGWIPKDTPADDFQHLFSGKSCVCKITWTGGGKGNLRKLFHIMREQDLITIPGNNGLETVLESHFVDKNGNYLTGLNSSGNGAKKSLPIINECIRILQQTIDFDD